MNGWEGTLDKKYKNMLDALGYTNYCRKDIENTQNIKKGD